MKRISFVLIVLILFLPLSFAGENGKTEYKILKNNGLFGLNNKKTNENIIPFEYKKIKKQENDIYKVKNQNNKWKILTDKNEIFLDGEFNKIKTFKINNKKAYKGIYSKKIKTVYMTSKDYDSNELLKKIFEKNNQISNIKFKNYPLSGTVILKKNGKYGFLSAQKDCIIYLPPKYHNIYVPDNSTIVFKFLGITYSDIENIKFYDGYYWFNFDKQGKEKNKKSYLSRFASSPYLEENAEIKENNLIFNYVSKSDELNNVILSAFPNEKENYFGIGEIKSNIKNYIDLSGDDIKIFENKNIYSIPKKNYEDFYFQDLNTIIYNVKNISYSNPDRIFAKKGNKWGIIDKYENIISGFQFDDVFGLNVKEIVKLEENGKKYNFDYKNVVVPKNNVFMVKKGGKYAVINDNGDILIPYQQFINKKMQNKIIKKYEKNNLILPYQTDTPLISKPFSLNIIQGYILSDINYPLIQRYIK